MKAVYQATTMLASMLASLCVCAAAAPASADNYGQVTLSFEANRGQTPAPVRYQARGGNGYTLLLEDSAASMVLRSPDKSPDVLRMSLLEAASVRPDAEQPLQGRSNYVLGNDPARWITGIPHYRRIRYRNVYPGVDWVYYGNQRNLEYDFVVAPGADPRQIRMKVQGATRVAIERATGDLLLHTSRGVVRQYKPVVYQMAGSMRQPVEGRYSVSGSEIAFEVGPYDRTRPLVIDPVLAYWSYLGGPSIDAATSIAVDANGNAYIAGWTLSTTGFPVQSAAQGTFGGGQSDAFVTKINAAGTQIVYSTYLGGTGTDEAYGIAVDSRAHAYITGQTTSANFPRVSAFRTTAAASEAFVTRLNEAGAVAYSTYLGGSGEDAGRAIAVDAAFNMYIAGDTTSSNFSGLNAATRSTGVDAFVLKLLASGAQAGYGVYTGGTGDDAAYGIALDSNLNAYIAGQTTSAGIATPPGSFQSNLSGPADAFAAKFDTNGTRVYWAYYGGTGSDSARAIAVDVAGSAYIAGSTVSSNIPRVNAFQNTFGGIVDAFAAKLSAAGNALAWATFLGGTANDDAYGIKVIGQSAVVAGWTLSTNFPLLASPKNADSGTYDGFVTQFGNDGSALIASSRVGGTAAERISGIAVDGQGAVYVAGYTSSSNVTSSIPGRTLQGVQDAFVAKLQPATALGLNKTQLYYGVASNGRTGPQAVQVTPPAGVSWTAVSNQPHILVSPASGSGPGTIQISLNPATAMPMASGTVTVSAPALSASAAVQVTITAVTGQNPDGTVDTPVNGATNLYGAIGVTGWAVDDTEVSRISLWRSPIGAEQTHPNGHVFIGDAVFLEGARPDVAALFPTRPFKERGGWGVQVLTNMLPNSNGQPGTGNGTYTFHVYAHDRDAKTKLLGSRTVSVNNAAATRPFGTLDTPGNGDTVSGTITVFGWALTPQPATIPTDGSTMWVFVDGVSLGHPVYNQFRPDIANLFPGYNNSNGAVGYYYLDTTKLTDGLHNLAWSVTDNLGRIEGIGSRLFWVRNGGVASDAPQEAAEISSAKSVARSARKSDGIISFRKGWDTQSRLENLDGAELAVEQGGRIELHVGGGVAGVNFNGSRGLPAGSTFDADAGVFSWHLDAAFKGEFDLTFLGESGAEPRHVRVRVAEKTE